MNLAIVTPVGPGHKDLAKHAEQTVMDAVRYSKGPFADVSWIRIDDIKGELGKGRARNRAIPIAIEQGADWIFWLDADDFLDMRALARMTPELMENYDAIWGRIITLEGPRQGQVTPRCYADMIARNPFFTIQIGFFVRVSVMQENRWHEGMNCGQDYEMYLRLWKNYQCVKLDCPFFVNRRGHHSGGPRARTGRDWVIAVEKLRAAALDEYAQACETEKAKA